MIPKLIVNWHSQQVTRTDTILLPVNPDGSPQPLPDKGDNITVGGVLYVVSHTHWDYDLKTIFVYASRRDN